MITVNHYLLAACAVLALLAALNYNRAENAELETIEVEADAKIQERILIAALVDAQNKQRAAEDALADLQSESRETVIITDADVLERRQRAAQWN